VTLFPATPKTRRTLSRLKRRPESSRESDERSREGRETILFVVDVAAPQFNFEGKDGAGRVLVAATAGRVVGRLVESSLQNRKEVTIALQKAQAHVAPTDVDVYAGVQWLDESAFVASDETSLTNSETSDLNDRDAKTSGYLLRRVFEPCSMDLAFVTKEPPKTETEPNDADDTKPETRKPPPSALTEFALKSPEIEAELTAEQFAALVDVVGSVFLAQLVDEPPPPGDRGGAPPRQHQPEPGGRRGPRVRRRRRRAAGEAQTGDVAPERGPRGFVGVASFRESFGVSKRDTKKKRRFARAFLRASRRRVGSFRGDRKSGGARAPQPPQTRHLFVVGDSTVQVGHAVRRAVVLGGARRGAAARARAPLGHERHHRLEAR
jgi:hypothetical protein